MANFTVDDDLVELVWHLANPKPFEQLSFSAALRRVLQPTAASINPKVPDAESLLARLGSITKAEPKKAPSPSVSEWAAKVPELRGRRGLHTWKAICDALKIETAGDSARRKLKNWVRANRPSWPPVPDIE